MRIAKKIITLTFSAVLSYMFIGCEEEDDKSYPPPQIQFITESGFVYQDTTLMLGDSARIGISAKTNSNEPLTHFNYTIIQDDTNITSIDTGIYTNNFRYQKLITKGISYEETWQFYVRDRDSRKSEVISITLKKDSASIFGEIIHIPSIVFGAQNNNSEKSFYSLSTQQLYSLDEAFNNQGKIDLLCFFDDEGDENTVSSPGANINESVFPGPHGLINWDTRNTTRFVEMEELSAADFDACSNDSLILANTFTFSSGKRKAKNLVPGDIYSFVTGIGERKGLFKVIDVQGQDEGIVEIAIKMQE